MKKYLILSLLITFSVSFFGQADIANTGESRRNKVQSELDSKKNRKNFRQQQQKGIKPGFDLQASSRSQQDIKQQMDSMVSSYDNGVEYLNDYKSEFYYDHFGDMIKTIDYDIDEESGASQATWISEYVYNPDGTMSTLVDYYWDYEIADWEKSWKEEFTYKEEGLMTLMMVYAWDISNSKWVESFKTEFNYNDSNLQKEFISYTWSASKDQWVESMKTEYIYDNADILIQEMVFIYGPDKSSWNVLSKVEYTYEDGELVLESLSDWESETSEWVNNWKYVYDFDSNNNMITETDYEWNIDMNQWDPSWKADYGYNNMYTTDDLLLPYEWYTLVNFRHMLTEANSYFWDSELSEWVEPDKTILYYSEQDVSAVTLTESETNKVYPNPAENSIQFKLENLHDKAIVKIYDLQGRIILNEEFVGNQKLSVTYFVCGLYIYSLEIDGEMINGKLLVR